VIVLRRRQFIFIMGGTAAAWSLPLRAQQGAQMRHIGVLLFGTPDTDPNLGAFLKGLRDLGYEESKTSPSSIDMRRAIRTGLADLRENSLAQNLT
jgi:hypothetical protein